MDDEGNTTEVILSLETKSVQPFKTQDEYLYAMKEDLAEWFNTLYGFDVTVENFFEQLETGVSLCQHANNVQSFILERLIEEKNGVFRGKKPLPKARDFINHLPEKGVSYRSKVKTGSFQARDNISNFITWCRGLGIDDVLMFETDDLVLRKNERHVVLCLLEVARRGAKYGMLAPTLIQFEEEIDAEIAGEEPAEPPAQRITCDLMSLDEMVREMVSQCTCPNQFPVIRVSEGKYQVGDSRTLIFVRILRNHVMVRIGGGWDTLQNYLNRHDPCRCGSKGHKVTGARSNTGVPAVKRKPSASGPSSDPRQARSFTPEPQFSQATPQQRSKRSNSLHPGAASYDSTASLTGRGTPQKGLLNRSLDTTAFDKAKSSQKGFLNKSFDGTNERKRRPSGSLEPPAPKSHSSTPSPASDVISPPLLGQLGRKSSLIVTEIPKSGADEQPTNSIKKASTNKGGVSKLNGLQNNFVTPKKNGTSARPVSARERGRTGIATPGPYGSHSKQRSRSRERTMSEGGHPVKTARSRSVGATELGRQLGGKGAPLSVRKGTEVLMISRDESGKHNVTPVTNGNNNNTRNGDEFKRPMTPRVQITPDRILPDKPKFLNRSASAESSDSNGSTNNNSSYGSVPTTPGKTPPFSKTSRSLSFSSVIDDDDDLDAPPEDKALNEKMERLFQEYLKLELGTNGEDTKYTFSPSRSRKASDSSEGSGSLSSYNSYSTRSASSFQKSCSSSREDILASNATSGRSSPVIINGSPKKGSFLTPSVSKHSISSMNPPGTPKSMRKNSNAKDSRSTTSRPSTPVRGRSGSIPRVDSRPPSAASSESSYSGRRPVTTRSRTSSREDLLDDRKPRERGRTPVRAVPPERGRTPTRVSGTQERGRTPTRVNGAQERGRTPTRVTAAPERGRTPTRVNGTQERGRTPTRTNSSYERGRTPTRVDMVNKNKETGQNATSAARARSRSRDVLGRNGQASRELTTVPASYNRSVSTPRPASAQTRSRSRDILGDNTSNQRVAARTTLQQKTKPSTPARPASARANPYQQRRGSREDLLDDATNKTKKVSTPVRPASARANPYHQRSRSREDLLDGESQAGRSRSRAVTNASRQRSASTTTIARNKLTVNQDKAAQTSPPYNAIPGQLDLDMTLIESRLTPKPRKDQKPGRTRIPMPEHQRLAQSDSTTPLKRFDSGVDIATISPTESSIHGDELWQNEILVSKMAQAGASFSHSTRNYEQPNLTYNCFDDDDDSEYF